MKAVKTDFIRDCYTREETAVQNRLDPKCSVDTWELIAKEQGRGDQWAEITKRRLSGE